MAAAVQVATSLAVSMTSVRGGAWKFSLVSLTFLDGFSSHCWTPLGIWIACVHVEYAERFVGEG